MIKDKEDWSNDYNKELAKQITWTWTQVLKA